MNDLELENIRLKELLKSVEWSDDHLFGHRCTHCWRFEYEGHNKDCKIGKEISKIKKKWCDSGHIENTLLSFTKYILQLWVIGKYSDDGTYTKCEDPELLVNDYMKYGKNNI